MRKICAVYDKDEQYAYRFMNYVNDKRLMPFDVIMFTKKTLLEEYLKESRVELLLIAQSTEGLAVSEDFEFPGENVGKLIRLIEEENDEVEGGVYKYQSTDMLVREVMKLCNGDDSEATAVISSKCRVLGVYSPIGRCYKTTFALALAQAASRNEKTLYVNLEEFCGVRELMKENKGNLSDLLYYFRHNQKKLYSRLTEIIAAVHGIDYIPACVSPEDYEEVMPEEWILFLVYIVEHGGYETIVLDIGNVVHEAWKLITLCKEVYMPVMQDEMGSFKMVQLEEYLKQQGKGTYLEKIVKIEVPYDEELRNANFLERLEWSSVGEYARRLIYG